MFRLFFLTFFGHFRGTQEQEHHLHESPRTMTVPLLILAFLSAVGGFIGIPHVFGERANFFGHWLEPVIPELQGKHRFIHIPAGVEWSVMIASTVLAALGLWVAYRMYYRRELAADEAIEQRMPALARTLENKYYVDEIYAAVIVRPLEIASRFLWKVVDAIIDGIAAMLGFVVRGFGDLLRFFQTGNVRNYALMFFLGVVVFMWMLA